MTVLSRLPLTPHLTPCTMANEPREDQTDLTVITVKVSINTCTLCYMHELLKMIDGAGFIPHTVFGHWTDSCEYDMVSNNVTYHNYYKNANKLDLFRAHTLHARVALYLRLECQCVIPISIDL